MKDKQKQNVRALTKTDRILFVGGIVAITLLSAYLADVLFAGHVIILLVGAILCALVLGVYLAVLCAPRPSRLAVGLVRIISYAGMGGAVLAAALVGYFLATFRW